MLHFFGVYLYWYSKKFELWAVSDLTVSLYFKVGFRFYIVKWALHFEKFYFQIYLHPTQEMYPPNLHMPYGQRIGRCQHQCLVQRNIRVPETNRENTGCHVVMKWKISLLLYRKNHRNQISMFL